MSAVRLGNYDVHIVLNRGAETRGGYIPPIIWLWSASERWMIFGFLFGLHWLSGTKTLQFSVKTFFFWSSLNFGDKNSSNFPWRPFFGLHLICLRENNSGRASSPPMFVENGAKLRIIPPNAQCKSAPLVLNIPQSKWKIVYEWVNCLKSAKILPSTWP